MIPVKSFQESANIIKLPQTINRQLWNYEMATPNITVIDERVCSPTMGNKNVSS